MLSRPTKKGQDNEPMCAQALGGKISNCRPAEL